MRLLLHQTLIETGKLETENFSRTGKCRFAASEQIYEKRELLRQV